jgi:hypothetical protein
MKSYELEKLERDLSRVKELVTHNEAAVQTSPRPQVQKVFLSSTAKIKADLENKIRLLKSERAFELFNMRLIGPQMSGSIQLRSLLKLVPKLNSALEHGAWNFWNKSGVSERVDENFIRLLDLRLAGIEPGSTNLVIVGNTQPDLTGESALENALRAIFKLLSSSADNLIDNVHEIGVSASKSISDLMSELEKENLAVEFNWGASDNYFRWDGRPAEITKIRTMLEEIGEPEVSLYEVEGIVEALSSRGRIEIFSLTSKIKISAKFNLDLHEKINKLHLKSKGVFVVERITFPIAATNKKKSIYILKDIK